MSFISHVSHILFPSENHANFYIDNLKVLSFEEFKVTRPALAIVVKKKLLSRWALHCSTPCIQAALHFDLNLSKHSSRLEEKIERRDEVRGESDEIAGERESGKQIMGETERRSEFG